MNCNAPRPTVCPSRLVFTLIRKRIDALYFLKTLQVRAPLFEFFMNFLNIEFFLNWKKFQGG